jgi:hypothetical protein
MRLFAVALAAVSLHAANLPYFSVLSDDPGAWPEILSSVGFEKRPAGISRVFVARPGAAASAEWPARVERGSILILEGESSLAELFGFRRNQKEDPIKVQSLTDIHRPTLPIIWEKGLELPVFEVPQTAQVFARERWTGHPMAAGFKRGQGAVFWIATTTGERGYERYPYILNALTDLGLDPPFRSNRLWAFFDSAYRTRADLDYLATRWRKAGIAALQVAAWHNFEPNPESDAFLAKLVETCHREGILVYAWFELPHASERFWADHPEWREKTVAGQDAHLDWRKLMNLRNPECFRAVSAGVRSLVQRFDWDGVNLAELYFESLEGVSNPARFTPDMPDYASRASLDRRADLVFQMQQDWLREVEQIRAGKPHLDIVLTHIDDRFDTSIRDALGADAARVLPLLDTHNFTFLIEDPATVWNLGPRRYPAIAERYEALTPHKDKLAIDLNIVDRYQNVYPTKQQTGSELFQLVHHAAASFPRVALYFENSLLTPDLKLLLSAAANVARVESIGAKLFVESRFSVGVAFKGWAKVDDRPWPARDDETIWLPAGAHTIEPAPATAAFGPRLLSLTAELKSARSVSPDTIEFSYESQSRAIARFDRQPRTMEIDGATVPPTPLLPRGQHLVTVTFLAD